MASSPSVASRPRLPQQELRLLVDMLRLSRVTLLIAEKGSDKSALLQSAVLPLLSHRGRGAEAEIPVLFDEWHGAPLPALHAQIRQAAGAAGAAVPPPGTGSLVTNLREWQEALDVTFIVILDRFEQFLTAPATRTGFAEFEEAFVQIANDPMIRANFLLAIDEDAEPLLGRLKRHIPRLGYSSVRVPRMEHEAETRATPERAPGRDRTSPAASSRAREQLSSGVEALPSKPGEERAPSALRQEERRAPRESSEQPGSSAGAAPELSLHVAPLGASPAPGTPGIAEPPRESSIVAGATPAHPVEPVARVESQRITTAESPENVASHRAPPPVHTARWKHRLRRVGWAPLLLIPAAWFFFTQPGPRDRAEHEAASTGTKAEAPREVAPAATPGANKPLAATQNTPAGEAAGRDTAAAPAPPHAAPRAEVAPPKPAPPTAPPRAEVAPPKAAPPAVPPRAEVAASKAAPPAVPPRAEVAPPKAAAPPPSPRAEVASATPPAAPAPSRAQVAAPKTTNTPVPPRAEVAPVKPASAPASPPAKAALAQPPSAPAPSRAEVGSPKGPSTVAKAPVAAAPATPAARKPEATAVKPPGAQSAAASAAVKPAEVLAKGPPSPAVARTPSGPVLHILVRNEAQRARAQQLVGPLQERGIQVAAVRVVAPSPDAAHIRYYRLNDRNEAMRVAVALRDLGLSAQQLKQMPEAETTGPGRTYELWLP